MAPPEIFSRFDNRFEAGQRLAEALMPRASARPLVVALPRGGVPVALPVAKRLQASMDIAVVRKIGHPDNLEYGVGALTEDGRFWLNPSFTVSALPGLDPVIDKERRELARRVELYRAGGQPAEVANRAVILVDDGMATGITARAAAGWLKGRGAKRIVVAAPVCADETARALEDVADEVICLERPRRFYAVGLWYHDFPQLLNSEVLELLKEAPHEVLGGLRAGS